MSDVNTSASASECAHVAYVLGNATVAILWQRVAAIRFCREYARRLAVVYGAFSLQRGDRVKVVRHERLGPTKRQWLADAEGVVVMVDEELASVLIELDTGRGSWVPGDCVEAL